MKYLALIALVLAGCSDEPRQYGAPVPLVWSTPTFTAPTFGTELPQRRAVLCQRVSWDSVSCY